MLMEAFDLDGRWITSTFIILSATHDTSSRNGYVVGYVIGRTGKKTNPFGSTFVELLNKQEELGFRIINRSGKRLPFLGEDI